MRTKAVLIQFGHDKVIETHHVQPVDIREAQTYIQAVLRGDIGYGYKRVKKYELHGIGELKYRLKHTQLRLEQPEMLSDWENYLYPDTTHEQSLAVTRLRNTCKMIKRKIKKHILFDGTTYLQFVKNYHKLHSHLTLLSQEGYIKSFTLRPNGSLYINWFSTWDTPQIDIIEQRIRSAENDRNIDGYNDWEDSFYNLAFRTLGVERKHVERDYDALWPLYRSAMHTSSGWGADITAIQTDGGYVPSGPNRTLADMHDITKPYEGPVILNEDKFNYCVTVLAIALHSQRKE